MNEIESMTSSPARTAKVILLAGAVAGSLFLTSALAETGAALSPAEPVVDAATPVASDAPAKASTSRSWHARESLYYKRNWGVDIVGVKPVTSGYMLAFRYRIVDPDKAKLMNDRKARAYIVDEASGIRLAVPAMENVGELRSGTTPEANRTYFMIFGNPGGLVKHGGKVTLVAGSLRAEGLEAE